MKGNGQALTAKQRGPNNTREWKEYDRWSRSNHSIAEIMPLICADLAELNKRQYITSLPPRHYDHKRGSIYGDVPTQLYGDVPPANQLVHAKGTIINNALLCPLVERCCNPCESKIVEMQGKFILHIHTEHTAAEQRKVSYTRQARFNLQRRQNCGNVHRV